MVGLLITVFVGWYWAIDIFLIVIVREYQFLVVSFCREYQFLVVSYCREYCEVVIIVVSYHFLLIIAVFVLFLFGVFTTSVTIGIDMPTCISLSCLFYIYHIGLYPGIRVMVYDENDVKRTHEKLTHVGARE